VVFWWLISRVLHGLLVVLWPAVLVVEVGVLRRGLYPCDRLTQVFPHKTNIDWKPLLETVETGMSDFTNQMVRFCWDRWQSGAPPGFNKVASPPVKRCLVSDGAWTTAIQGIKAPSSISNWRKEEKLGQKYEKCKFDWFGWWWLQSVVTYVYIGSRMQLFGSDMTKSFLNKRNLKPYSDFICYRKTE
jgi:hypothetical protein